MFLLTISLYERKLNWIEFIMSELNLKVKNFFVIHKFNIFWLWPKKHCLRSRSCLAKSRSAGLNYEGNVGTFTEFGWVALERMPVLFTAPPEHLCPRVSDQMMRLTRAIWSAICRRPSSSLLIWAACSSRLSNCKNTHKVILVTISPHNSSH